MDGDGRSLLLGRGFLLGRGLGSGSLGRLLGNGSGSLFDLLGGTLRGSRLFAGGRERNFLRRRLLGGRLFGSGSGDLFDGSGSFFGCGNGLLGGSFLLHGGVHRGFGALGVIHYRICRDLLGRGALSEEGLFLCGGRRGLLGLLGDRLFGSGYLFDGSGDFLRCGSFEGGSRSGDFLRCGSFRGGSRRGDFLSCGSRRDGLHRRGSAQADLAVIVVNERADGSVRVVVDEFAFEELDLVVVVIEVNEGTHKQSPNYP